MPMINEPIEFRQEFTELIQSKLTDPLFTHQHWSSDDLLELRREIRNYYREKQKGICAYCKNELSLEGVGNCHAEHIAPKSLHKQFMFQAENLCVICSDCNTIKRAQETISDIPETINNPNGRAQYPRSSNAFKIVHPHFDNWDDHLLKFRKAYIDKSSKGGFTIQSCKLNRFFHHFGIDESYIDDSELNALMSSFLESTSSIQRQRILTKLQAILFAI